jgi:hypothetical protein
MFTQGILAELRPLCYASGMLDDAMKEDNKAK